MTASHVFSIPYLLSLSVSLSLSLSYPSRILSIVSLIPVVVRSVILVSLPVLQQLLKLLLSAFV